MSKFERGVPLDNVEEKIHSIKRIVRNLKLRISIKRCIIGAVCLMAAVLAYWNLRIDVFTQKSIEVSTETGRQTPSLKDNQAAPLLNATIKTSLPDFDQIKNCSMCIDTTWTHRISQTKDAKSKEGYRGLLRYKKALADSLLELEIDRYKRHIALSDTSNFKEPWETYLRRLRSRSYQYSLEFPEHCAIKAKVF